VAATKYDKRMNTVNATNSWGGHKPTGPTKPAVTKENYHSHYILRVKMTAVYDSSRKQKPLCEETKRYKAYRRDLPIGVTFAALFLFSFVPSLGLCDSVLFLPSLAWCVEGGYRYE
jgi:hypothetical protein